MAKLHIRRTLIFIILGIIGGFLYATLTPKVYEANLQLVVGAPNLGAGRTGRTDLPQELLDQIAPGQPRNPATELNILRGKALFQQALARVQEAGANIDVQRELDQYYSMYDVLGERESDAAIVRARAYDPQVAAQLANAVAEQYNETRLNAANASMELAKDNLKREIDIAQADLDAANNARKAYKEENSIADLTSSINNNTAYLTTAKGNLDTAETELKQAEQAVLTTKARLDSSAKRQDAESVKQRNPVVTKLEVDLADLKRQRATALARYHEDNPNVRELDDAIKSVSAQLAQERKRPTIPYSSADRVDPIRQGLENQYNNTLINRDALKRRVENLRTVVSEQEQRMKNLTGAERKLVDLDREVVVRENNVRNLKVSYETLKSQSGTKGRAAQVLGAAIPNEQAVFPNPLIVSLLAIFGGAALGLLYSFAVESLRLRIYTSYQLADLTGLPVVASLPKLPGASIRQLEGTLGTSSPRILESIRLLAFSLVAQPHEGCRRLLFSGLDRHTGSSSSAAQLAIALGHTGSKVILVDADLTGRSSSRIFKSEGQRGLAEALTTDSSLESLGESLRETGSDNVKLLPAGISNDRAVKECETRRLEDVMTWLSSRCEYLIFDTPPCLRNSEAARLASETDEVYLVVSLRISTVPLVSAALDIMRQAGANVVRLLTTEGDRSEEALAREARVSSASRALPS